MIVASIKRIHLLLRSPLPALILICCIAGCCYASDQGWPQFRGINGQGVSSVAPPPAIFGSSSNLLWKTEAPHGHSSPVFAGDRLFITGLHTGKLQTIAYDRGTGKLLWMHSAPAQ